MRERLVRLLRVLDRIAQLKRDLSKSFAMKNLGPAKQIIGIRIFRDRAVGSLMYAMVCTRPDLAHAVGVVSRFLSNPGKKHWEAVKWIFRYLRGTSKSGITFGNGKPTLVGYTDSYLAGNKDNMKSTSGYLMTFAGGAVSWQSRLQKDAIEDGMFELNKVHTDDNDSDMLTKAVAREKLKIWCSFVGMANSSS
nr:retrovirus-related Pol polyprotein from transposon TNT 1-94 [Tanacetum cinerariifolium]